MASDFDAEIRRLTAELLRAGEVIKPRLADCEQIKYLASRFVNTQSCFFIPRGFAHGFAVLSDEAVFQYKCDNYYAPASEGGIAWDDPALAIDWRLPAGEILLSEKDRRHPQLADAPELFEYDRP